MIDRGKIMTTATDDKLVELKRFMDGLKGQPRSESNLIAVLHKTQELYGYLPEEAMDRIAEEMSIPTAQIWGVATFYHYFNLEAPGQYVISVCLGTACYVKGAGPVMQAIQDELEIDVGQTTEDGLFSLQPARCLGACGLAPVVMINDKIHGDLTPKKMVSLIRKYRKEAQKKSA